MNAAANSLGETTINEEGFKEEEEEIGKLGVVGGVVDDDPGVVEVSDPKHFRLNSSCAAEIGPPAIAHT